MKVDQTTKMNEYFIHCHILSEGRCETDMLAIRSEDKDNKADACRVS